MFWKLDCEQAAPARETDAERFAGRFVLHRHHDAEGPHLDLRLEQDGYLVGWRIESTKLEGGLWAREKGPHPVAWLEQNGDAMREDAGLYAWLERDAAGGTLILRGAQGDRVLRVRRVSGLPTAAMRDVCEALRECAAPADHAGRLVRDGVAARRRAIARLCGLGRELDGSAFDETVWRRTLESCSLDEIHAHLRAFEVRFDTKYPPQPVSRPVPLADAPPCGGRNRALEIVQNG